MRTRKLRVATNVVVSTLFLYLFLAGCSGLKPTAPTVDISSTPRNPIIPVTDSTQIGPNSSPEITPLLKIGFDGQKAMDHVIAQVSLGPRPTGSDASNQTATYIESQLASDAWQVTTQPFTYKETSAKNIIAKSGEGANVVIVGAHYDTRRRADQDNAIPQSPVPGANDGASGVAVLLELARVLDLESVKSQVWLVFFDAEDNGQLDGWDWIVGSRYFVSKLEIVPQYAIIVDMVGDKDQNLFLDGNSDRVLRDHLWDIAGSLGYGEYFVPKPRYSMLDDHTPFMQQGIPAVDIIDFDYAYWHTSRDTTDKVSPESLERVGRLLETFLESGGDYPPSN